MNSLREVDGAEAMVVSSLSVTLPETRPLELAELAGEVCLLYSDHQQLIQLARSARSTGS